MIHVLFSSHDGASTLPRMLDRCVSLSPVAGGFRIVAVDNASTDGTPGILDRYRSSLPLTVLAEPRKGKNRALNRALAYVMPTAGAGDLIVFTDDDVLPEPDWLARLDEAARARPDHDIFGGTIRPHWPAMPPPAWIAEWRVPVGEMYSVTAQETGPVDASFVWGPNMAIRARTLASGQRFEEAIGPDGTWAYAMGSETELTVRLQRAGSRAWFAGEAVVAHVIRPEQLSEEWLIRRGFRHGLGITRYRELFGPRTRRVFGIPRKFAAELVAYRIAGAFAGLLPPSRHRFRIRYRDQWLRGVFRSEIGRTRPKSI